MTMAIDPRKEIASSESGEEKINAVENGALSDIDTAMNKRVIRKLDMHILPWLFGMWLLAFIDRSNIGNARIDGLIEDLNLYGNRFNTALAVFYVPYILIDVPSNWILKRIGAGWYLPLLITLWGIVGTCMGLTKSYAGLIVCRLLLGLFEGGLFGGMVLYVSMFYRRHDMLLRIGLWYCAAPLSGAFGGLLAAGLSRIRVGGYDRWPWIFIVEGIATIVFGVISFFFLPHTPATAKFLTQEERDAAVLRMQIDGRGTTKEQNVDYEKFNWHWVRMAAFNWHTLLLCLNCLFILVPIYSFSLFLPTIIRGLGYRDVTAQLFTVPPNIVGFLFVLGSTFMSDRYKLRGPFILGAATLSLIGYIMMIAASRPTIQYGGTFLVGAAAYIMSPTVFTWLNNNLAPHYVRATGTGIQVSIGNCAAFIATFTYLEKDSPRYIQGHAINIGALGMTIITTAITMLYFQRENAAKASGKRDHLLGEDEALLGYRHPDFKYTV